MVKENIEIVGSHEVADDIQKKIRTVGVKWLKYEEAEKLGVFQRIANILCVCHATILAAYHVYGHFDYLIDMLNARKNEIAREMNMFDKAIDRFVRFWTGYYAKGTNGMEVNLEAENLYHYLMSYMQIPEKWELGDEQRTEPKGTLAIRIDIPDEKVLTFHKTEVGNKIVDERETWGVLCYDMKANTQTTVNTDMDKSSAQMVAKRLSDENPDKIYTAAIIRDLVEKRTEVMPFKAFKANEMVGKITQ